MADNEQESQRKRLRARFASMGEERTDLALKRTALASDRTLLAWLRTSLSLITFGFTIYKFFQFLVESGAARAGWQASGPRHFAVALVTLATVMLAWQGAVHYRLLRRLSRIRGRKAPITPTLVASGAVVLLGLFLLGSIVFRVGLF
jgi:putative membrane protein